MFVLPPPEAANPTGAGGFFPPTFQSFTSFYYDYLLDFGNDTCQSAGDINNAWPGVNAGIMRTRYANGIFCRKPVRSLKVYSYGLTYAQASNMLLEVWKGQNLITTFVIKFHQIGLDLPGNKTQPTQGFAFPVIADTSYEYRISMISNKYKTYPNGDLPSDWVVEFSEPVFGNRWKPDQIILTVQGQGCRKKLVTSQHDRRWQWATSTDYPSPQSWGRGACNSVNPDMPVIKCPAVPKPVLGLSCDSESAKTCNNGHFDCGSKKCVCNPGYFGPDCKSNICDNARCGSHGKCIATYLGGELLPSLGTCACDQGWSGPNCDQNVCSGVTCSGRGYCQAKGDTDYQCVCDPAYTGYNCEKVKQDMCTMCPSPFLSACGFGRILDNTKAICNAGTRNVGCYRTKDPNFKVSSNACCFSNCEKCDLTRCPPATNDCHLSAACNRLDGTCGPQIERPDGSPCNSIPFGQCSKGFCQPTAITPKNRTYTVETFAPSAAPSTFIPTFTNAPSKKPTVTPTVRAQYKYLGCFGDGPVRAMTNIANVNSMLECYYLAYFKGYSYYGLQFGKECWVSNNFTKSAMYGKCGTCKNCANTVCNCANKPCANGDKCGDIWANAMYMVNTAPSKTPSYAPSISTMEPTADLTDSPTVAALSDTDVSKSQALEPVDPMIFTATPTLEMSAVPILESDSPTCIPSLNPSVEPTPMTTTTSTVSITTTAEPMEAPTAEPTLAVVTALTTEPTFARVTASTAEPTLEVTIEPTTGPTCAAVSALTTEPTLAMTTPQFTETPSLESSEQNISSTTRFLISDQTADISPKLSSKLHFTTIFVLIVSLILLLVAIKYLYICKTNTLWKRAVSTENLDTSSDFII